MTEKKPTAVLTFKLTEKGRKVLEALRPIMEPDKEDKPS